MVNDDEKTRRQCEKCHDTYEQAKAKYSQAIKAGAGDKEIKAKGVCCDKARNSFYSSIIEVLLENKKFSDLQPFKVQLLQLLNSLWLHYFQEIDIYSGNLHPIPDYNHLKELQDEANGLDKLRNFLTTFNLEELRKAYFPINIIYNKKTVASINSFRIWCKVFEILQREMLDNPDYTFNIQQAEQRYFTKNSRKKNAGDIGRIEMTAGICDFLNAVTPFRGKDNHSIFIAELYTLLKMPI